MDIRRRVQCFDIMHVGLIKKCTYKWNIWIFYIDLKNNIIHILLKHATRTLSVLYNETTQVLIDFLNVGYGCFAKIIETS